MEGVQPLFQLAGHHLDGDHRVVDQQAQRDDERAGGDAVQVDAEDLHAQEGGGQDQRDGQRHHHAGTQPQTEQADRQHDDDRFQQRAGEDIHGPFHHLGLVGDLAELDAHRQIGAQLAHAGIQVAAQLQHVAVAHHRDGNADGIPALIAHHHGGRILIAAGDAGDVPQADDASPHGQSQRLDSLHVVELAAHVQPHAAGVGVQGAGRGHQVLGLHLAGDGLGRQAQPRQACGRQGDVDLFGLHTHQLHLGHVGHVQQLVAHVLGVAAQPRHVDAVAGHGVDGAEDVAEFIVEERPLDGRRQPVADVADLLAHLVPVVLHLVGRRRVLQHQHDQRLTRFGVAGGVLEVGNLLHRLLDAVGDEFVHLLGRGARPERAHHHRPEGVVGVLALAQAEEGQRTADAADQQEKERHLPVAQRNGREVEALAPGGAGIGGLWGFGNVRHRHAPPSLRCVSGCSGALEAPCPLSWLSGRAPGSCTF